MGALRAEVRLATLKLGKAITGIIWRKKGLLFSFFQGKEVLERGLRSARGRGGGRQRRG